MTVLGPVERAVPADAVPADDVPADADPVRFAYPVFFSLVDKPCLVVGGGTIAARKIRGLLLARADITVVAPEVLPEVARLPVRVIERSYERGEAASYRLVIACTNVDSVNAQVFRDAEATGVPVNSADDPANCSFILPAVSRTGKLTLAVSTDGQSPAAASWIRRQLDADYNERFATLIALAADVRAEAKQAFGTTELPQWGDAFDDHLLALIEKGELDEARNRLRKAVDLPSSDETEFHV